MAKSADHYWLRDFEADLRAIGEENAAAKIEDAEFAIKEATRFRNELVKRLFDENKDAIKPRLRPCHLRRFDTLAVEIWNG